ncbi:hypothetical protein K8Z61_11265 [Nocardioides sp. TRM66260-LWL]|uniref:hypothetical protein n=1 Tax=Nocardioides sp. TRM66260-LWL TaxID=2874478 RepID=UPI001CC65DF1|nr:hypothetical protein [Nocardioides sp. TRM66260-LWL]MBZ5735078.1 hypothetical protein [Nocardioides sp. TRM66260-LWL]
MSRSVRPLLGLTVRWSLVDTADDVVDELATHVAGPEHDRHTGQAGLRFAQWRAVRGAWFECVLLFADEASRQRHQEALEVGGAGTALSRVVGAPPALVEPCEVLGLAEGWDGFATPAAELD